MGNTHSDLGSMVHSYYSMRAHAEESKLLPLGKPGTEVFDTRSTCAEDGGTTRALRSRTGTSMLECV